jgi:hypothetical protein
MSIESAKIEPKERFALLLPPNRHTPPKWEAKLAPSQGLAGAQLCKSVRHFIGGSPVGNTVGQMMTHLDLFFGLARQHNIGVRTQGKLRKLHH